MSSEARSRKAGLNLNNVSFPSKLGKSRLSRQSRGYAGKKLYLLVLILLLTTEIFPQWVQTNGPSERIISSIAVIDTNLFAGTHRSGVFLSTNNGTNWTSVNSGLTDLLVHCLAVNGSKLYAGTGFLSGGIFLSTNNGVDWTQIYSGFAIYSIAVSSNERGKTNILAGGFRSIIHSTDDGLSWIEVNSGLNCSLVNSIIANGSHIFAGTSSGVFHTTNNDIRWNTANLTNTYVYTLTAFGKKVFAGTAEGIFLAAENDTNWIIVNNVLRDVRSFVTNDTNLFAGSVSDEGGGGVLVSTNNGTSWTLINSGLMNTSVFCLAVSGSNLFAGTVGSGVWRRPLSEMITDVEGATELPKNFILEQNYPNPFNPTTSIEYRVGSTEYVTLKVYDVLGNEVATLVNEIKPAGSYEVEFDASNLSSGIYFYQLKVYPVPGGAGNFVQTKKMLLIK
jgi:hypothetical protein